MSEQQQSAEIDVRVGDIWADNDWRVQGRTIEVTAVENRYVYAVVATDADHNVRSTVGNPVRILRRRMRPTSTGFRLVTRPGCPQGNGCTPGCSCDPMGDDS